ncbi:PAS domain S-box protein [Candidatus Omnitrophota bacterium]
MKKNKKIDVALKKEVTKLRRQVVQLQIQEGKRKKAEDVLRESELKHRRMIENAQALVMLTRPDAVVTYLSPSCKEILGHKPSELEGTVPNIFHPDDAKRVQRALAQALKGKSGSGLEYRVITKKGQIKWISHSWSSVLQDKRIREIISIIIDVTERKKVEEALQESEQRYRDIYHTAPLAFVLWDRNCRVTGWNECARKLFGWSKDEVLGRNFFKFLIPKEARAQVKDVVASLFSGELPSRTINKNLTKSGKIVICEWNNTICYDTDGSVTGVISLALDITDRVKAEEALRESEQRFKDIFDKAADGILVADPETRKFYDANKIMCSMLGFNLKEIKNIGIDDIHPIESISYILEQFNKIKEGQLRLIQDLPMKRKNGSIFYADINSYPITLLGRTYIIGIFRDVTERKQIEQTKAGLIRDVSHGLKTPIAMTEMAISITQEGIRLQDFDQIMKAQEIASNNIKKLRKDVDNILEAFTLDMRKLHVEKKRKRRSSLNAALSQIARDMEYLLDDKMVTLKIDIAEDADTILIDKRDLSVVFNNIIDNAIKFTQEGSITVISRDEDNRIVVAVRDTGCGIASEDRKRVFERFFKRHPAVGGSGLGLSICKEIMGVNNGSITIESEGLGKGTTVVVELPKG